MMGRVWICPECGEKNWSESGDQVRCDNCCNWFNFDNLKKRE